MSVTFTQGKHVLTVSWGSRSDAAFVAAGSDCGECQSSCQSACKTSCTVGNQACALLEQGDSAEVADAEVAGVRC